MRQAVEINYTNRMNLLQQQQKNRVISDEEYAVERVKALQIYLSGMALEQYRMNQITLPELVESITRTLKGKSNE